MCHAAKLTHEQVLALLLRPMPQRAEDRRERLHGLWLLREPWQFPGEPAQKSQQPQSPGVSLGRRQARC